MAKIAVIIVNYNATELAVTAVNSVLDPARRHGGHEVSVHLVDNASTDGGAAILEKARIGWGDRVTLYLETTNHGFGRGNNLVLHKLETDPEPPEFVFLLNPDAQLKNDAIEQLATFLETHPKAAMAGARAYNPGDPNPVTAAFRFPGLVSTFAASFNFGPVTRFLRRFSVAIGAKLDTQKVDWVSGAAVMARFDVWRDLGFFDPEYFLYYEEVDLTLRCARAGWECWHVAEAEVVHIEGASTDVRTANAGRTRRPAYWYHSWQYYFRKNYGRAYALLAASAWIKGVAGNLILSRLRGRQAIAPKQFFGDFWANGLRPLLGLKPVSRD
ncbi:hypothetical protein BCF46_3905 [Litoreibacter meonggei]|uniref:Glycosyltransferase 2-like domain-containing protein n=1 Tax=Litoreibacter meonggei TaxID=1049199 RepID=A0A497V6R7_9RHOB|nr:glycosyltransferase family 2 protein [Litoreibacter meonggei]RLJ36215.1 hypothetical protein BCF46_3905 [Litoreibacter meonggei]